MALALFCSGRRWRMAAAQRKQTDRSFKMVANALRWLPGWRERERERERATTHTHTGQGMGHVLVCVTENV